jgi:hypothetical protein
MINRQMQPFLFSFAESGPEPVLVTGQYDPDCQMWINATVPARTPQPTSQPTQNTTFRPTPNDQTTDLDPDTRSDDWSD